MAMISIDLTDEEQRVLINLLDGACRQFGGAAAQGVAHFQNKLAQAAQSVNVSPRSNGVDVERTANIAADHQPGSA